MKRRGFTVVEIIITVTVMGILLTLAVVNVNSSQARARDDKRKADIQSITEALETYFVIRPNTTAAIGRYPATTQVNTPTGLRTSFPDANFTTFTPPGANSTSDGFVVATNSTQTTAGVSPQPTISQYVYQPINETGTLCTLSTSICRKFNLYYRLEADNQVYRVGSKNQ